MPCLALYLVSCISYNVLTNSLPLVGHDILGGEVAHSPADVSGHFLGYAFLCSSLFELVAA